MFQEPMYRMTDALALEQKDWDFMIEKAPNMDYLGRENFGIGWRAAAVAWGAIVNHNIVDHVPDGALGPPPEFDLVPDAEKLWKGKPICMAWSEMDRNNRILLAAWLVTFWDTAEAGVEIPVIDCPHEKSIFLAVAAAIAPQGSTVYRIKHAAEEAIHIVGPEHVPGAIAGLRNRLPLS
jgi:hypothetical protein